MAVRCNQYNTIARARAIGSDKDTGLFGFPASPEREKKTPFLARIAKSNWHATIWIITFGPIDTIFTATGAILINGGVYAWRMLPLFEIN
jgi:hypothetical protein